MNMSVLFTNNFKFSSSYSESINNTYHSCLQYKDTGRKYSFHWHTHIHIIPMHGKMELMCQTTLLLSFKEPDTGALMATA